MVKLRFIHLMILLAIYENSDDETGIPSQNDLIGKSPKYDGMINNLMFGIYLLDDDGETNNPIYGKKMRGTSTFQRSVETLREIDAIEAEGGYGLTPYGEHFATQIQEHLADHPHYSELPVGAIVQDDGEIEFKYYKEV